MILDPVKPGQTESRVVERKCSSDPQELASATQATTLLMSMCININYGGGCTNWRGTAGTCDAAGYGVKDIGAKWGALDDNISSLKLYGACNQAGLYENTNYNFRQPGREQFYGGNTPYVGAYMNDRATSVVVYHAI
ncbi:hypothetical protein FB561_2794 [Kribbella amoyensis]|uniref:Uncharacterized protein n=1 Tax=Kribbella amoyensis TaxID=996641 RepID=A0A561BS05_9ACTN|nr:hypothetical protein FB561_2794 [Kribbella amoyensis]